MANKKETPAAETVTSQPVFDRSTAEQRLSAIQQEIAALQREETQLIRQLDGAIAKEETTASHNKTTLDIRDYLDGQAKARAERAERKAKLEELGLSAEDFVTAAPVDRRGRRRQAA